MDRYQERQHVYASRRPGNTWILQAHNPLYKITMRVIVSEVDEQHERSVVNQVMQ